MNTATQTADKAALETPVSITGAEAVVRCLIEEGIDTVFGYPGGAIMPIYDAMMGFSEQIHHVLGRHEQGSAHACEGWARVTNQASVCMATSGPGAANFVTGIVDAFMDSTPMVCILGQVPKHLLGMDAFQETDVIGITQGVTKWNFQVTSADEIPEAIAKAFYIANTGRPGPVVIDITKNAQVENFEWTGYEKCTSVRGYNPRPEINQTAIEKAAELINQAERPMILSGHGVLISGAEKALKAVVEKAGIPVVTTMQGLGSFPHDHELYVGIPGMHGNYGPNMLTNECDVLFAIGMRFDDRITGDVSKYAKQAKVIHIDIDPAEIDKIIKTDVAIIGDAKDALEALLSHIQENSHKDWLQRFRDCDKIEYEKVIKRELESKGEKAKMGEVVKRLEEKTNGEAILVADVGQHQMAVMRYYGYQPNSHISSGGSGTMGFALPAAIGAQMAAPDRTTIAIIGDGSFQMTIQELGTIFQQKLPVKIVILNNSFLGMVRQWQQLFFDKRYAQTELINPDFIKISEGYGIPAEKAETQAQLSDALDRMLEHDGPYLVEVVIEREDNVFPMVPSGAAVNEMILSENDR